MERLEATQIGHATWGGDVYRKGTDPVKLESIRNFAFRRMVKLEEMYIYPISIRWIPSLTGQPKHVTVESFDSRQGCFVRIKDLDLEEFAGPDPHKISLDGFTTDNLRVVCDLEHPVAPSHSEQWKSPGVVPFAILDGVYFFGEYVGESYQPVYNPPMEKGSIQPLGDGPVSATIKAETVQFESPYFKIAFSLRRPLILHLGWDDMGRGKSGQNLLFARSVWREDMVTSCGPVVLGISDTYTSQSYTGTVEVAGTTITYRDVHADSTCSTDYIFTIHEKGMAISIEKRVFEDFHAYEQDDLRFIWDMEKTITGTLCVPYGTQGRTGTAPLPALWNAPGYGCVELRDEDSSGAADIQQDTWRYKKAGWCGIDLGAARDRHGFITISKGHYRSSLKLTTSPVLPRADEGLIPAGLWRGWASALTFRPELGGFSNNSCACNCHLSQQGIASLLPFTKEDHDGIRIIDMLEYTMELSLRGGPGYGDWRNLFLDSDPSVLIAAGKLFAAKGDKEWVCRLFPYIRETIGRMLGNCDETGLLVCTTLSGNSGTKKWSCNAFDVLSFGHYDAYSNAQAYLALLYSAELADAAGDQELRGIVQSAAQKIKASYADILINPETGLVSGWRSADGQHHDYAFTVFNYMAICYGLLSPEQSAYIINRLETMMKDAGLEDYHYGIPINLISIRNCDAPTGNDYKRDDGLDNYGIYLNGCLTPNVVLHYIMALDQYGYKEKADLVCTQLLESYEDCTFSGGIGTGTEFFSWEGRPCGYEGLLVGSFTSLAAIVEHLGILDPSDRMYKVLSQTRQEDI